MSKGVKYGKRDNEDMKRVLEAVRKSDVGLNVASCKHSVPTQLNLKNIKQKELFCSGKQSSDLEEWGRGGGEISPHEEQELVNFILQLEQRLFGTTVTDLRGLAMYNAELNHFSYIFNKDKETAVKKWYKGFIDDTHT